MIQVKRMLWKLPRAKRFTTGPLGDSPMDYFLKVVSFLDRPLKPLGHGSLQEVMDGLEAQLRYEKREHSDTLRRLEITKDTDKSVYLYKTPKAKFKLTYYAATPHVKEYYTLEVLDCASMNREKLMELEDYLGTPLEFELKGSRTKKDIKRMMELVTYPGRR
jgi:hypothetical protein